MHEEINNRALRSLVVSLRIAIFFCAIVVTSQSTNEMSQGIGSDVMFEHSGNVQNENLPEVPFTSVAVSCGIHFQHSNAAQGQLLMPELFGSGCAFIDFDQDHDQDLLLLNSNYWPDQPFDTSADKKSPPSIVLYKNDSSGRFSDVTSESGLNPKLYGTRPRLRCHQKLSADTGWMATEAMLATKQIQHKACAAKPLLQEARG